ncbi:fibroblast growth factor receptor substrate 3-like [Nilaparvata lugens]|uniref:fibroblast growth factor receptor substrate 3-like n=1 Tax=Nilaparvata lugens TaxID=108931 RepID=UPI00193E93AA|nr:fibroblast growth factor receptor substrate 3-like [Nilaparvata lugens]XP_039285218.1 fibroblast growth factor receptor substrate 3-like [Nilaparvata lugens]
MGCVCSKHTDNHPTIFQVVNVDEEGQKLHDGQLEVTDTDLIVYQRQRSPVRWPLRSLRRYGFDADIFSFESGRRCRTGPGVYAFRCRRAEELFNLLQSHIQMRNSTTEDAISRELSGTQLSHQHQRPVSCGSGSEYMEPTPLRPETTPLRQETTQLRHNSVASNGPLSPASAVLPSSPPYVNGDLPAAAATTRQHCRQLSRSFSSNSASLALAVPSEAAPTLRRDNQPAPLMFTQSHTSYERTTVVQVSPTYSISSETNLMARMEECRVIASDGGSEDGAANGGTPFYINIKPGMHNLQSPPPVACAGDRCPGSDRLQACAGDSDRLVRPPVSEDLHEYANLELGADLEMVGAGVRRMERSLTRQSFVLPANLANRSVVSRQVNYAVLDLERDQPVPPSPVSLAAPTDDARPAQRYATIDFDKTIALSNSINPSVGQESEGCRVTRHDPDFDPTRHRHRGESSGDSTTGESRKASLSRSTRGFTDRLSASLNE